MTSRNFQRSETESAGNAAERETTAGISRRKALQVGGFVGAGSLLGVSGATNDVAASADGSEPKEEIYLNYDGYDSWDEIYRMSNGSGDNLSLVSSPTYSGDGSLQLAVREDEHWYAQLLAVSWLSSGDYFDQARGIGLVRGKDERAGDYLDR